MTLLADCPFLAQRQLGESVTRGWEADISLVPCGARSETKGTSFFPSPASIKTRIDG